MTMELVCCRLVVLEATTDTSETFYIFNSQQQSLKPHVSSFMQEVCSWMRAELSKLSKLTKLTKLTLQVVTGDRM